MALPAYAQFLANLRGPAGEQGRPGTFDSATAESVPADQSAEAIISGAEGEVVHFKIPRGLPGVNAVDNDTAVAGYVAATDSDTRVALAQAVDEDAATALADDGSDLTLAAIARFPVVLVWDDVLEEYPPRVDGASHVYVGAGDPSLEMNPAKDVWTNPAAASLADVEAGVLDSGSSLHAAVGLVGRGDSFFVPFSWFDPVGTNAPTKTYIGTGPYLAGWLMPDSANSRVQTVVPTPKGWNSIRLRVMYSHGVSGATGDVRWQTSTAQITTGSAFTAGTNDRFGTGAVNGQYVVSLITTSDSGGGVAVNPAGGYIRLGVERRTDSAADTTTAAVVLVGVVVERIS